jgi:hypothetical protein
MLRPGIVLPCKGIRSRSCLVLYVTARTRLSIVDGRVLATRSTFGSARMDAQVYLPVPTLRITGPFDDLNRASAVKSVTVQVSVDDGAGWRSVPGRGGRRSWASGRDRVRVAQCEGGGCGG